MEPFAATLRELDMTGKAVPTVQIDNARVRVTEWRFAPGAATGHHRHEFDYVVVPQTTGRLRIIGPDGSESDADLQTGVAYSRDAGVEHDVINANDFEFVFVEVEIK
jgi:quercetin dioxygenase-like cupin family protein